MSYSPTFFAFCLTTRALPLYPRPRLSPSSTDTRPPSPDTFPPILRNLRRGLQGPGHQHEQGCGTQEDKTRSRRRRCSQYGYPGNQSAKGAQGRPRCQVSSPSRNLFSLPLLPSSSRAPAPNVACIKPSASSGRTRSGRFCSSGHFWSLHALSPRFIPFVSSCSLSLQNPVLLSVCRRPSLGVMSHPCIRYRLRSLDR